MLLVNLDRNRATVISNRYYFFTDFNLNVSHLHIPLVIVCSINENLIKYLVESWNIFHLLEDNLSIFKNEHLFILFLNTTYICVWPFEDMLYLGHLLILLLYGLVLFHLDFNILISKIIWCIYIGIPSHFFN